MSIAENWNTKHIGGYLKLLSGFPFPSKNFSDDEGFPLIRIRDIVDSRVETYYQGPFLPTYIIKEGDILIGMDGDFNIAKWRNQDALLNQRVLKIDVTDSDQLDLEFIYYWLQPYIKKVNDLTAATTVKHLSTKDLIRAKDNVPDILPQRRIGKILGKLDQTIEKTEALIEKYQQIKAGLMHDLFTRGITADGKLRPTREQAPELYQETPIGWIPKAWNHEAIESLKESLVDGPFGSNLKTEHYINDPEARVVRLQNIQATAYNDRDKAFVSFKHANTLLRNKVSSGDILIAGLGEERYPVGRACLYPESLPPAINKADCFRLRCNQQKMINPYMMYFLNTSASRIQIRKYEQGVTRPRINLGNMKKIVAPMPDLNEQKLVVERLNKAQDVINSETSKLNKLIKEKHGLMRDLLTGIVPVKIEEPEAAYV
ncbi:restriction endonuclease subunit S [Microbulbifer sp. ANSA003]|uniref:restriction endonuclease subunit S n=1 Tax=Microbulbifer sp. ANSA003 TaxID=3243360 RepID=UPI004041AA10